jgi:hypothetical protein
MINHLPVVGMVLITLLLFVSLYRRSRELQLVTLWGIVLLAVATIPVFLTGEPAEHLVEEIAGVSHDHIEEHEEFAKISFIAMLVLGGAGAVGLFLLRRREVMAGPFAGIMVLLSVAVMAMMGWAGHLGGEIRHSEIRDGAVSEEGEGDRGRGRGRNRGGSN